jgi:hypothetical protein
MQPWISFTPPLVMILIVFSRTKDKIIDVIFSSSHVGRCVIRIDAARKRAGR